MKPLSKKDNPLTEEEKAKKKNVPSLLTQFTIFNQQVVILSFKYLLPVTYTPRLTQRALSVEGEWTDGRKSTATKSVWTTDPAYEQCSPRRTGAESLTRRQVTSDEENALDDLVKNSSNTSRPEWRKPWCPKNKSERHLPLKRQE
jgi:hypothetical protein